MPTGNEYQPKCAVMLCGWGVKAGRPYGALHCEMNHTCLYYIFHLTINVWVAGKTV